jgi:Holliday junction resolvase RusA-like endonuclease
VTDRQDALDPGLGVMPVPAAAVEVGIGDHLVVVAHGLPVGQGSMTRNQHGALYSTNAKKLRPWRDTLTSGAREAIEEMHGDRELPLFARGTPVHVGMTFTFPRPASHYGTGRNAAALKATAPMEYIGFPDVDKAIRAVLDAFSAAGVWDDDRQVSRVIEAARVYPGGHRDALAIPGAVIRVRAVAP